MTGGPDDPMAGLTEAAVSIHELFVSLVEAGFTEAQALSLVAQMFRPSGDE